MRLDINSPAYARFMILLGFLSLLSVLGALALGFYCLATWQFHLEFIPAVATAASSTLAVIYLHSRALQENPDLFKKSEKEVKKNENKSTEYI